MNTCCCSKSMEFLTIPNMCWVIVPPRWGLNRFFYDYPTSSDVGSIIPRLWRS